MKKFLLTAAAILLAVVSVNAQFSNGSKSKSSSGGGDIEWRGEINAGVGFGNLKFDESGIKDKSSFTAPGISGVFGSKLNDYLFLGAGIGFEYAAFDGGSATLLPLFAEVKGFYPVSDFTPFAMIDLGYGIGLGVSDDKIDDLKLKGGLLFRIGVGAQYNKFTFGLGYEMQKIGLEPNGYKTYDASMNAFFIRFGYVIMGE